MFGNLLHFNPRADNMCLVPALYRLRDPTVNRTRQRLVQTRRIVAQGVGHAGTLSPRMPLHTGHRTHATIVESLIPMELAPEDISVWRWRRQNRRARHDGQIAIRLTTAIYRITCRDLESNLSPKKDPRNSDAGTVVCASSV